MESPADLERARLSLEGLAIGDAFGELFFELSPAGSPPSHSADMPAARWRSSGRSEMALTGGSWRRASSAADRTATARPCAPRRSADASGATVITHAHPEGRAGATAVAAAAAIAAQPTPPVGRDFLGAVLPFVPEGLTRNGTELAIEIRGDELVRAAERLGAGSRVSAQDTVPFCLWVAAHHLHKFEEAL